MSRDELTEEQQAALDALRSAQQQYDAVIRRTKEYRELFRDERFAALRKAADLKVPTKLLAEELHTTTVWVNKVLRGEAYRKTD